MITSLFLLLLAGTGTAAREWNFGLPDSNGTLHSQQDWRHRDAVVLWFISTDCPISNRYAPSMAQLAAEYGENVGFYGVHSDPDITAASAQKHAGDYRLQFPILLDPDQTLASHYGVSVTPTAVVVSASGEMLYRGRIDDRSVDFGQWRNLPGKQDLRDAITAALAGRTIPRPFPEAIGCFLPSRRSS